MRCRHPSKSANYLSNTGFKGCFFPPQRTRLPTAALGALWFGGPISVFAFDDSCRSALFVTPSILRISHPRSATELENRDGSTEVASRAAFNGEKHMPHGTHNLLGTRGAFRPEGRSDYEILMRIRAKTVLEIFLFLVAASWVMHTVLRNFVVDPNFEKLLLGKSGFVPTHTWLFVLRLHIVLAVVALLAGALNLVGRLRRRHINIHRYLGRTYVLSILLNYFPSIYLSCFATGGVAGALGFFALNFVWIGTTYKAYRSARNREIAEHRRWMIRSYAVTLANLQLYVWKTVLSKIAGLDYESAYIAAVWSCWIGGLLVAEMLIRGIF